jgi:hypothetical protein
MNYIVTTESDDGSWFDEPEGFESETEAREWIASHPVSRPEIYTVLYRCTMIEVL